MTNQEQSYRNRKEYTVLLFLQRTNEVANAFDVCCPALLKIVVVREIKIIDRIISWKKNKWLELTELAENEWEINLPGFFSKLRCQGIFPRSDLYPQVDFVASSFGEHSLSLSLHCSLLVTSAVLNNKWSLA